MPFASAPYRFVWLLLLGGLSACATDVVVPPDAAAVQYRVFTGGRELTDAKVKSRFLGRLAMPFQLSASEEPGDFVQLVAPDTAFFRPHPGKFSFTKTGAQYLFYSPFLPPTTYPATFGRAIAKFTSPLVPVPYTVGEYTTREVRVGYEQGGNMQVAVLLYRLRQPNAAGGDFTEQSGLLFNEFNDAAIASIRVGDTLAVQVSRISIPIR